MSLLGCLAMLFAFSALDKYRDVETFRQQIKNYQLMPEALVMPMSALLFATEVITATLLITQGYRWGLIAAAALLSVYAAGIWINLIRGRRHIDCGCLGSQGEGISYYHVTRNLLLTGMAVVCLLPDTARELGWLDYLVIPVSVACGALLYLTFNLLIANSSNQKQWWS